MALASHLPTHYTYYTYYGKVREGKLLRPAMRLVMADFLIRHGAITPDNEADYERIVLAMHQERLVL